MKKIMYTIAKLEENIIEIKAENIKYYVIEKEIHIHTKNTLLIFSLADNIDQQIEKIVVFNKQHYQIKNPGIFYIDLRVANKIFYCKTDDQNICEKNLTRIYGR
jgi:hypothetical protein